MRIQHHHKRKPLTDSRPETIQVRMSGSFGEHELVIFAKSTELDTNGNRKSVVVVLSEPDMERIVEIWEGRD
jgi:hypothetical protein